MDEPDQGGSKLKDVPGSCGEGSTAPMEQAVKEEQRRGAKGSAGKVGRQEVRGA